MQCVIAHTHTPTPHIYIAQCPTNPTPHASLTSCVNITQLYSHLNSMIYSFIPSPLYAFNAAQSAFCCALKNSPIYTALLKLNPLLRSSMYMALRWKYAFGTQKL